MGKEKKEKKKFTLTVIEQAPGAEGHFDQIKIIETDIFKTYEDAFSAMYKRVNNMFGEELIIHDDPEAPSIYLETEEHRVVGTVDLDDHWGYMLFYGRSAAYIVGFNEVGYQNIVR